MLSSQLSITKPAGRSFRSAHRLPKRTITISRAKTYDLVFQGGGAKGIAYVGVLEALNKANFNVGRLLGTSAGAITAGLLSLGFSAQEIKDTLSEETPDGKPVLATFQDTPKSFKEATYQNCQLRKAIDRSKGVPWFLKLPLSILLEIVFTSTPPTRNAFSLIERGGLYKGDACYEWFVEQINKKYPGEGKTLTFKQLHDYNVKAGKPADLTVCASNVTREQLLALNHRTSPDLPIAMAVRMSMSIPFVWQEVEWDIRWGRYNKKDISGDIIVDGGCLSNLPLELFLSDSKRVQRLMGNKSTDSVVIGCSLDDDVAPKGVDVTPKDPNSFEIKTMVRVERLIRMMLDASDKVYQTEYAQNIVRCPTEGLGLLDFGIDANTRELFINAAEGAFIKTINNLDPSALKHLSNKEITQYSHLLDDKVHGELAVGKGPKAGSVEAIDKQALAYFEYDEEPAETEEEQEQEKELTPA